MIIKQDDWRWTICCSQKQIFSRFYYFDLVIIRIHFKVEYPQFFFVVEYHTTAAKKRKHQHKLGINILKILTSALNFFVSCANVDVYEHHEVRSTSKVLKRAVLKTKIENRDMVFLYFCRR